MLQDLEDKRLENEYIFAQPEKDDIVLYFSENDILVQNDKDGYIHLPALSEFKECNIENLIYLFKIGEKKYFLYLTEKKCSIKGYEFTNARSMRDINSKETCFAVLTGWHLYTWYKNNKFCGRCASETVHDDKERMLKCEKCGNMIYPRISPAVIIAVTKGDKLLLSKYAGRNYTRYALLAGYTEIGETIEETVKREVMEEVGLYVDNIRYYKSQPWGVDGNVLMGFYCDAVGDEEIRLDKNELSMAQWFDRKLLPAKDDGFSLTREMIRIFEEEKEPR